VQGFSWG